MQIIFELSSFFCLIRNSFYSVDASNAGEGQLEIAVNDGEVPNQVQVLGNGKCLISFIPELIMPHVVDIKFNNENVFGIKIFVIFYLFNLIIMLYFRLSIFV